MKNIQGQSARKSRHTISRVTALRSTCSIRRQENMSGTYARRTTTITASMLSGWITPSRITVFTISIITAILKDRRSPAATSIRSYTAVSSMIRRRGCRTIKYFLLGGSPALCPNGGEIDCDFAPIPYKHSSFPDIPFGMPDFKLFCFQPLKSMLSLMKKDDSPFFRSESCNEAY